jgi:hypothetical protein
MWPVRKDEVQHQKSENQIENLDFREVALPERLTE